VETTLAQVDFTALTARPYFPSPTHWEDEVLYFLMLDRFSDGRETNYLDNFGNLVTTGTTPLFQIQIDAENAAQTDADKANWSAAGTRFVGGTLKGLESKLGYLARLGVTAIWVSPVFKQVATQETYHGYGVQNFLDVDPRFGTRQDLIDLVQEAHRLGLRVVLDIILNHAGDVFTYLPGEERCDVFDDDGNFKGREFCWQSDAAHRYGVLGYRDNLGAPTLQMPGLTGTGFAPIAPAFHFPNAAIWPSEFQPVGTFTRKGKIRNYNFDPEFREGDFETLKDIHLGSGPVDAYLPSAALKDLCSVFKFWIALTDVDGFRVDTVKHMDDGASRYFTSVIHEFSESLGKENFYLIAEITGGRARAVDTLELVGMNAALGIDDIPDKVEYLVKGFRDAESYFSLFRNSELVGQGSHTWFRDKIVNTLDDHDQVRKGQSKSRFAHAETDNQLGSFRGSLAVLGLLTTSLGIPCIYYGTEQQFDGSGQGDGADRFIREAMFGGEFGAFRSRQRHFFNEGNFVFVELSQILRLRRQLLPLRRGRQYLRQISGDGENFGFPKVPGPGARMLSIVAFSRIFNDQEVLVAFNTNFDQETTAWVTIDDSLHASAGASGHLTCLYSSSAIETGQQIPVEARNGKAVRLTVPPAGFVIYR
jgi:glycosidase